MAGTPLEGFHPAVATWFRRRFPEGPTPAQAQGWPAIRAGDDALIAAPTGSGKTLAAFLVAIDALYRAHAAGQEVSGTRVVYVSPLKALAVDVDRNLQRPLAEIGEVAAELGMVPPPLSVAVRTGDTTASARAAMVGSPPTFLVTTPESLYLLVTAQRTRAVLRQVDTVVVDEIHALARDKRGAHLALTLERLDALQGGPRPQRIGLSATQRPLDATARLLSGTGPGRPTRVVDCGHARHLCLALELPGSELAAVASTEQFGEVVDRIAAHVRAHRTTLVFVNTRRMAERLAHLLGEQLGPDQVAAHHGSLSRDRRLRVEQRLRAGELRALVATASLELGIDVGPVELVCQVGSPRSIATFLQRVGRSNHSRHGVPEGVVFPLTRDELVECAALFAAVRAGLLDEIHPPVAPLDILVQQVVAEVAAAGEVGEDELFALVRRAAPYASLERADFDAVVALASDGIPTGRGTRLAYLHRDQVHRKLRPRRAARLVALTSGGAIPDVGDYRVVLDPEDVLVGTVNEDFAIESMAGDVFLLGTHAWRIRRVEQGTVRVVDADGAQPTIPFWIGEAPSRTDELSAAVAELRAVVDDLLGQGAAHHVVAAEVQRRCGVGHDVAMQLVTYLAAGRAVLGVLPTQRDVVFERFFDDAGGMQLVVHAPFGGRITRALGLALRKRFCATFDFELQAAATDDAVVLSLGPQHSFPLARAPKLLPSHAVVGAMSQAVLASPLFRARWRWNLTRALAVPRTRGGRRTPLPVQRMEADDVLAAVFPALAACQDNMPAGPIPVPDHVLVRQTMHDCLHEAMDVDGLVEVVRAMETGAIRLHFAEVPEPSVLAHEILNGRPFTFLDDAPLEERRTRAAPTRRGLPLADDLGRLTGTVDAASVARVRQQVRPQPREAEELHDLLLSLVVARPQPAWQPWFDALVRSGRAGVLVGPGTPEEGLWCAAERQQWAHALFPGTTMAPAPLLPASLATSPAPDADTAVAEAVRGRLEVAGPTTVDELADDCALPASRLAVGLARLEAEGFAVRGRFDPGIDAEQWCARHLLARIHADTRHRRRAEIAPVPARDFVRFLLRWQHVAPGTQRLGRGGVLASVQQLQGFEVPAGAWEDAVLPARVEGYQHRWLEDLCMAGELVWARLSLRPAEGDPSQRRGAATPSRATPLTFARRGDVAWLVRAVRGDASPVEPAHGAARDILEALRRHGALFHTELRALTGRLPEEVEAGLWDLVARGLVTADGFHAVRSLLSARERWQRHHRAARRSSVGRRAGRRTTGWRDGGEGRWSLLGDVAARAASGPGLVPGEAGRKRHGDERDLHDLAEAVATQLLARWGVVFWDLVARESMAVPWRQVLWALRRFEARGVVRGGRFVTGCVGEQYALPEAVDELRRVRHTPLTGEQVTLSAADPLNLVGIVLPGARVPAVRTHWITYVDGLPAAAATRVPDSRMAAGR